MISDDRVVPLSDLHAWLLVENSRPVTITGNRTPEIVKRDIQGVTERGNVTTAAVEDGGKQELAAWIKQYDRGGFSNRRSRLWMAARDKSSRRKAPQVLGTVAADQPQSR